MANTRDTTPPFLQLPQELHDDILARVASPCDLLNLALVSKACSKLVIPRHIEYRIIRIRYRLPNLWAHLAKRADLARGIRELHLCERNNYLSPDHCPTTLVPKESTKPRESFSQEDQKMAYIEEDLRVQNMCTALGHMDKLEVFTWSANVIAPMLPTVLPKHEEDIMRAVASRPALKQLALAGPFGRMAPDIRFDQKSIGYPLWTASKFTSLSLVGDVWARPLIAPHVKAMLKSSTGTLEYLEVPMELSAMTDCILPALRKLKIYLQSGSTNRIDQHWTKFLGNHPDIEELFWFPVAPVKLDKDILPNIKSLQTSEYFMESLNSVVDVGTRKLERLYVTLCEPGDFFHKTRSVHGESMKMLMINDVTPVEPQVESYEQLAATFPNLTWLFCPEFRLPIDGWVDFLADFKELEVFRGSGVWSAAYGDMKEMHAALCRLAFSCPNLKVVDHCEYHERRRNWKDIVFVREGEQGENVHYGVRKPLPRPHFDTMEGIFG